VRGCETCRSRNLRKNCLLIGASNPRFPSASFEIVVSDLKLIPVGTRWIGYLIKRYVLARSFEALSDNPQARLVHLKSDGKEKSPNCASEGDLVSLKGEGVKGTAQADLLLTNGDEKVPEPPTRGQPGEKLYPLDGVALTRGIGADQERQGASGRVGSRKLLKFLMGMLWIIVGRVYTCCGMGHTGDLLTRA
jgi:hypothetical protein